MFLFVIEIVAMPILDEANTGLDQNKLTCADLSQDHLKWAPSKLFHEHYVHPCPCHSYSLTITFEFVSTPQWNLISTPINKLPKTPPKLMKRRQLDCKLSSQDL